MSYDATSPKSKVRQSVRQLSDDSGAYMAHARQLRRQEAESLVQRELGRVAAARHMSTVEQITNILIILCLIGLPLSLLAFGLSFLVK